MHVSVIFCVNLLYVLCDKNTPSTASYVIANFRKKRRGDLITDVMHLDMFHFGMRFSII